MRSCRERSSSSFIARRIGSASWAEAEETEDRSQKTEVRREESRKATFFFWLLASDFCLLAVAACRLPPAAWLLAPGSWILITWPPSAGRAAAGDPMGDPFFGSRFPRPAAPENWPTRALAR